MAIIIHLILQMYFRQAWKLLLQQVYVFAYINSIQPSLFCGCWDHVIMSGWPLCSVCMCLCDEPVYCETWEVMSDTSDLSDKQK